MSLQFTEFVTPVTFTHFVLWSRGWMKQCDAKLWGCRCPNRITDMSEGFFFSLWWVWPLTLWPCFKTFGFSLLAGYSKYKVKIALQWDDAIPYTVLFSPIAVLFSPFFLANTLRLEVVQADFVERELISYTGIRTILN